MSVVINVHDDLARRLQAEADYRRVPVEVLATIVIEQTTLSTVRAKVEKHIKNTFLKRMQAPVGVKPILKAWMELN